METIDRLKDVGYFGPIDVQMAGLVAWMHDEGETPPEPLLLAVALASRAINGGHACVNLEDYACREWADVLAEHLPLSRDAGAADESEDPVHEEQPGMRGTLPDLETWKRCLVQPAVGNGSEEGEARTLLVLQGHRLYLRRYWEYERRVENRLKALNCPSGQCVSPDALDKYFGPDDGEQRQAAKNAIEKRLTLLSGGPGTGKTYTLATVVALLTETVEAGGVPPAIYMAAPTGKAAVRMAESIAGAKARLRERGARNDVLERIPERATTIHRLLGVQYHSPYFKHDSSTPLPADFVIVDEASMVDLPLMAKLLDALPGHCRLMLVGDVDQLASVEPGRVYGDVCAAAEENGPLDGCLTRLTKSRRFPEASAIGQISRQVNGGDADAAWKAMQEWAGRDHLVVHDAGTLRQSADETLGKLVREQMQAFLETSDAPGALNAANRFRILCTLRKGPYGVEQMNRRVERILAGEGLKPGKRFYDHQIIMIRVNTPSLRLFNGDVGVILKEQGGAKGEYRAWFPDAEQGVPRAVPVNLLPDHEPAFAMTVHKAQGSEFPCVAMILPDDTDSPVLCRQLLYTGMTRVKIDREKNTGTLVLWCAERVFRTAVERKTARVTGLFR